MSNQISYWMKILDDKILLSNNLFINNIKITSYKNPDFSAGIFVVNCV